MMAWVGTANNYCFGAGVVGAVTGCCTTTVVGLLYPAAVATRSRSATNVPIVSEGDIVSEENRAAKVVLRRVRNEPRPDTG